LQPENRFVSLVKAIGILDRCMGLADASQPADGLRQGRRASRHEQLSQGAENLVAAGEKHILLLGDRPYLGRPPVERKPGSLEQGFALLFAKRQFIGQPQDLPSVCGHRGPIQPFDNGIAVHADLVRQLLLGEPNASQIVTKQVRKVFTLCFHTLQSSSRPCTIVAHTMSPFWLYTPLDRSIHMNKVVRTIVFNRGENDADQLALAGSRAHALLY
jgi:hypothetical protein